MKVALLSMPTLASHIPSFQLALLKPLLERHGIEVEPRSLFMDFARVIGPQLNDALAEVYPSLVGEWIWSKAAFGDFADDKAYFARYGRHLEAICAKAGVSVQQLQRVRDEVAFEFIEKVVASTDWSRFSAIGFTVVFQQMVASLALAKAIKAKQPDVKILFGGATFEDDLAEEVLARAPYVDVVHCGDAELTLPELLKRLGANQPLDGLKGAMHRGGRYAGRAPNLENLDLTPVPDFDEHFQRRDALRLDEDTDVETMLPIETARGCWYGMKNHCTFCGLNRAGMDFRSKSPKQVLEMLDALSRRYGVRYFNAIDNILAPEYATKLFGELAKGHTDLKLHYEIRPNLGRAQLKAMKQGGLNSVQPGVESFSTHVLSLMKKHTTGVRNLELLKWTTYYGIDNQYNVLYGFHGETESDYRAQAELMRKIPHVQPPYAFALARADRGSPMFEKPGEHGVHHLRPSACYPFIFPPSFDYAHIAYFFEDDRVPEEHAWHRECGEIVDDWKRRWESSRRPTLTYFKAVGSLSIQDLRGPQRRALRYDGRAAELYERCADAQRSDALREAYAGEERWLEQTLQDFVAQDVMVHLDDRYLALALPANPNH